MRVASVLMPSLARCTVISMPTEQDCLQDLMLLSRAAQVVLQEEVLGDLPGVDLAPARMSLLRVLGQQKRQSINDVARFLGQTKAAASQNVDSLAGSGLVRRQADDRDRRLVWVTLTPAGRRLLAKLEARQRAALGRALEGLPAKDRVFLSRGLRRLAFALLDLSRAEPATCLQCCAYNSAGCVKEHGAWCCAYILKGRQPRGVLQPGGARQRGFAGVPGKG